MLAAFSITTRAKVHLLKNHRVRIRTNNKCGIVVCAGTTIIMLKVYNAEAIAAAIIIADLNTSTQMFIYLCVCDICICLIYFISVYTCIIIVIV